jgi:alkanesulfonate monooxygenase SsuD/methylene tetrahydromethanopterin reductase-like flavin-dependent oxidoreductase (luciferase family)
LIRECFVGRDAAHARDTSRGPLLSKYRAYASWGQGATAKRDFSATFDDFARDRFLIGDAEQVKDGVLRYAETARTDHILLRMQWPGLEHREALGSIERVGRIIAALR